MRILEQITIFCWILARFWIKKLQLKCKDILEKIKFKQYARQ